MKMSAILRSSKIVSVLLIFVLVSGCSWFGGKKSTSQARRDSRSLEVPPELTQPKASDSMTIPVVTPEQAGYGPRPADQQTAVVDTTLLPGPVGARVVREGDLRWAELEGRPETVWQEAQGFLRSLGFEISYEDAQLGILETNWLSNRAYRNIGFLKSLFGGVTVTGLRDRYRIRLERTDDPAITRLYLAHQGLIEDVIEDDTGESINRLWRWRPNDPELEAEVLQRFLVFRGMDEKQAEQVTTPQPRVERAVLQDVSSGQLVVVNDNFARTWRRVGVAIDRLGLVVDDRNRSEGLYYLSLSEDFIEQHKQDSGVLKKWFGGDEEKKASKKFVLKLEERGETTTVSLHDQNGQLDNSSTAKVLNEQLYQQLR
jgi:outer membrane protein assembly factor BamC